MFIVVIVMYFVIKEVLEECSKDYIKVCDEKYVAVLNLKEWRVQRDSFDMGIDIELETADILNTTADVNYDSLTGTFCIPNRLNLFEEHKFAFALDEKGIVFIDDSGIVKDMIKKIQISRRWRFPSLERFLYDFLEQIIKDDFRLMANYERELGMIEREIIQDEDAMPNRVNDMRGDIRDLRIHYEQLLDLGQIFEENENSFFEDENIRYFHLFLNRVERLRDMASSIRDYTIQVGDLYKSHLDIKQNRIITILTVITSIFMPLTLITGWFGMNFKNMPELESPFGYPVVFIICVLIIISSLLFFKRKKWL